MASTDADWARGYALQALADLDTRELLAQHGAPRCHRLQFLQMAAEKAVKAHLALENGHVAVRRTHAYVAKNLPIIARQFHSRSASGATIQPWVLAAIKQMAKEIELLAPACDDGGAREDNCEYPWPGPDGTVHVPCQEGFAGLNDSTAANNKAFVEVVKILRAAATAYAV